MQPPIDAVGNVLKMLSPTSLEELTFVYCPNVCDNIWGCLGPNVRTLRTKHSLNILFK
ncbi:hypothetical protein B0H17DRAFT_1077540 [Mycena rosella]|uniref:Uncharacterized protein n=1 Tax=Mycena rosella TaxID=1033263 RepID=A0AAD7G9E5_MYCRO|nr:hypothetical protein B0H17DRAFT_1077540 [Mycena rosella]